MRLLFGINRHMKPPRGAQCLLVVAVLCLSGLGRWVYADDEEPLKDGVTNAPAAGHSLHGEAFDEGPRQKASLMGGTGKVHLKITTRHPQAQAFFDQGIGQLHGFWYFEA